jgi:hypothetical protein
MNNREPNNEMGLIRSSNKKARKTDEHGARKNHKIYE